MGPSRKATPAAGESRGCLWSPVPWLGLAATPQATAAFQAPLEVSLTRADNRSTQSKQLTLLSSLYSTTVILQPRQSPCPVPHTVKLNHGAAAPCDPHKLVVRL